MLYFFDANIDKEKNLKEKQMNFIRPIINNAEQSDTSRISLIQLLRQAVKKRNMQQ
jgi:hypothetical protein